MPANRSPILPPRPSQENHFSWVIWLAPVLFLMGLIVRGTDIRYPGEGAVVDPQDAPAAVDLDLTTASPNSPLSQATAPALLSAPLVAPTLPSPTPEFVLAHLSFYWPPYGDINCDHECEHIANGDDWKTWVDQGVACPGRYPLGTIFEIQGDRWECVDRGEAIVVNEDGSIWLDLLASKMPYGLAWGSIQMVEVHRPE